MHTDPIADLLTRIRNAQHAHHQVLTAPHSKIKESLLKIMQEKGFIEGFKTETEGAHKNLRITLHEGRTGINFKRVSKPGQRIYIKSEDLKPLMSGLGIRVISTSKGLMTNNEAKKQNIGGELICEIY